LFENNLNEHTPQKQQQHQKADEMGGVLENKMT
jgi:hypothetical protein